MQMCPNCGRVYDESEYTHCPNCRSSKRVADISDEAYVLSCPDCSKIFFREPWESKWSCPRCGFERNS